MKTNKKAILGFAVTMIFSLAIMQGISTKNNKQDANIQQIGAASMYVAGNSESTSTKVTAGLTGAFWTGIATWCVDGAFATGVVTPAAATCWAGAAVAGL